MPNYIPHKVKKGETISQIAKQYKVEEHKIVQANPEKIKLKKVGKKYEPFIYEGETLKIPQKAKPETYIIKGNSQMTMGAEEVFELLTQDNKTPSLKSDKIKWIFRVDEGSNWRELRLEKEKTGQKITITFLNEKLKGKKFKIIPYYLAKPLATATVQLNEENKKPLATAEAKIEGESKKEIHKLELLDSNRNKIGKRTMSYAETLYARAQCTGMEGESLSFTLWEDDAKGGGHDKSNEKNLVETKLAEVTKGIAEAKFPLIQTKLVPIANKGGVETDPYHEYYVTASSYGEIVKASEPNVNVNNPDYKPPKKKEEKPKQQPQPPKKEQKKEKEPQLVFEGQINPLEAINQKMQSFLGGRIDKVYITDLQNREIKQHITYGSKVKVHN